MLTAVEGGYAVQAVTEKGKALLASAKTEERDVAVPKPATEAPVSPVLPVQEWAAPLQRPLLGQASASAASRAGCAPSSAPPAAALTCATPSEADGTVLAAALLGRLPAGGLLPHRRRPQPPAHQAAAPAPALLLQVQLRAPGLRPAGLRGLRPLRGGVPGEHRHPRDADGYPEEGLSSHGVVTPVTGRRRTPSSAEAYE